MRSYVEDTTQLSPGDLVDVIFEIATSNATLASYAISKVKADVAADKRWHYQGSVIEDRTDPETGRTFRALVITVQAVDPAKVTGNHPEVTVYEANALAVVAVIVGGIAALAIAGAVIYRDYTWQKHPVMRTINDMKWPLVIIIALLVWMWIEKKK